MNYKGDFSCIKKVWDPYGKIERQKQLVPFCSRLDNKVDKFKHWAQLQGFVQSEQQQKPLLLLQQDLPSG